MLNPCQWRGLVAQGGPRMQSEMEELNLTHRCPGLLTCGFRMLNLRSLCFGVALANLGSHNSGWPEASAPAMDAISIFVPRLLAAQGDGGGCPRTRSEKFVFGPQDKLPWMAHLLLPKSSA